MNAINKAIDTAMRSVMAASALTLFVVTFLQVVFRFLLKSPLAWSQDIIRLCFTYLTFFGAAWCVKEKAHLNIDVLLTSLKPALRKLIEIVINLILLAFFVFLAYYGFLFARSGSTQLAPYLPIPMSAYYMSVPLSAVFMFFYLVQQLVDLIKGNESKEEGAA